MTKLEESTPQTAPLTWDDLPELMDDLRDLAKRLLQHWPQMHSLQPTLLVSTALRRQRSAAQCWSEVTWQTRDQLFGQVFRAMRHKLVEYRIHQRTRGYQAQRRVSVPELELYEAWRRWTEDPDLALALETALEHLSEKHPGLARIVEYRFFAGLEWHEVARMLERGNSTVRRDWDKARVILQLLLREQLQA